MTHKQDLIDLRDKVKTGDDVDALIFLVENFEPFDDVWEHAGRVINSGSIDAARALHEAVCPKLGRSVDATVPSMGIEVSLYNSGGESFTGDDKCEARAWLLAILEYLIKREKDQ